ncbi:putative zinc/iron permease [Helianthus annuus]|nr:putative zinc/iron permease [Helianthus annuus]
MIKMGIGKLAFVSFLFLDIITTHVLAKCPCEPEEKEGKKNEALQYKLIALASILVAGALGVCIPFIGKVVPALSPEKDGFFIIKAFAAGVILATGFIHVLPDAFDKLTNPCLNEHPWGDFPFTGLIAMVATMLTLLFETSSAAYQLRSHESKTVLKPDNGYGDEEQSPQHMGQVAAHTHATHGHAHGSISDLSQVDRYRIVSKVSNTFFSVLLFFFFFTCVQFTTLLRGARPKNPNQPKVGVPHCDVRPEGGRAEMQTCNVRDVVAPPSLSHTLVCVNFLTL